LLSETHQIVGSFLALQKVV